MLNLFQHLKAQIKSAGPVRSDSYREEGLSDDVGGAVNDSGASKDVLRACKARPDPSSATPY